MAKNEFPNVPDKELVTNNRYVLRNDISFDNFNNHFAPAISPLFHEFAN